MITQAGQVLVQLADNIMVGHVGTAELAGVSFANSIFVIGLIALIGFSQGIIPLVGQSVGENNHISVANYLKNSTLLNIIAYSSVFLILFIIGFFMHRFGQKPEVVAFANQYYFINLFSIIPMAVFFTLRFFAEGVGNTKYAMWVTVISNLINVFLNWLLIYGHWGLPAMGVVGAATATLVSRILCAVVFLVIFFKAKKFLYYTRLSYSLPFQKQTLRELFYISYPIALTGLLESTAFCFFAVVMVGWIGTVELATHQIVQSLGNLSFMVATGIGSATTIRVSHQIGAGKVDDAKMAGIAALHLALLYMGTCGLIFVLLRHSLPYAFTNDPLVIQASSSLILILGLYQIFDAIQLTSISALRGLKDTKVPMLISAIAYYLISVPLGYLLGLKCNLGVNGVWLGLTFGLLFIAIISYVRFIRMIKIIK